MHVQTTLNNATCYSFTESHLLVLYESISPLSMNQIIEFCPDILYTHSKGVQPTSGDSIPLFMFQRCVAVHVHKLHFDLLGFLHTAEFGYRAHIVI